MAYICGVLEKQASCIEPPRANRFAAISICAIGGTREHSGLRISRRRFTFWPGFGLFSLAEKLRANGLDELAAATMHVADSALETTLLRAVAVDNQSSVLLDCALLLLEISTVAHTGHRAEGIEKAGTAGAG